MNFVDKEDNLLTPFRTWRNTNTARAAGELTELFRFSFQDVALNLSAPAVAKAVTLDLLQRMDSNAQSVANLEAQALKDYTPGSQWIPYYYETIYTPTRIDQTILSLSGLHTSYDGKAHPSYSASSATYDLLTGKYLSVSDILSGSADAVKTLSDALIEALDKVASEHSLFTGYQDIIRDTFSADLNRHYTWYFTSEGICFYFSPYEIAPNSAGIIEVTVPYSKLTGVLKDAEGNDVKFTFFKHASFSIQIGQRHIYNDPVAEYAKYAQLPKADVVLVTHSHYDHLDRAAIDDITNLRIFFFITVPP